MAVDTERILGFLRQIAGLISYGDIADALLSCLDACGLDARVQLRTMRGAISRDLRGTCSPLEESVLTNMSTCDRIVDLGRRSAFNYPHVSIIVNNMPRGDANQYGHLKDIVLKFAETVDVQLGSVDLTLEAIDRGDTLLNLLRRNAGILRDIEQRHKAQREKSACILNQLVKEIEDSFYFMGLTDQQETHLQDLARNAIAANQALYDEAIETDAIMKSLGEGLDAALQQELQGVAESSGEENRIELF